MKVSINDLQNVASEFFGSVLLPEAIRAGGLTAFSVSFVGGLAIKQVPQMVQQYLKPAKALGLVDELDLLDIDLAYNQATEALKNSPLVIYGYKVEQTDLDKLKELMQKYGR